MTKVSPCHFNSGNVVSCGENEARQFSLQVQSASMTAEGAKAIFNSIVNYMTLEYAMHMLQMLCCS